MGAVIGWVTNYIAIRLLFRPLQPWHFPLIPVSFQGLIPSRREQIADKVGQVVDEQLFSMDELTSKLNMPQLQLEADRIVREAVERWCSDKMNRLPGALRDYCSSYLRDAVAAEVARQFPKMASTLFDSLQQHVNVHRMVAEKINNLSLTAVEEMVLELARRELKQIEWLGAVLGFLIGLLQALLVYFLV
jgi:uncharacterized membrane protein YheB (UPF0754 family)